MRTIELKIKPKHEALEKIEKFQKLLGIEQWMTWDDVSQKVMKKIQSCANKLDIIITEKDWEYKVYKKNLFTIESFIPQLIERIKYTEETNLLEEVGEVTLPALKRTLSDLIILRNMIKEECPLLIEKQRIFVLKTYLDFIKFMFFLQ